MRVCLIIFLLVSNCIYSQFIPPTVGVHYKKSSSTSEESFVIDFDNDDDCTSGCSSSFYAEVPWTTNLSTYTVSLWVKSGEEDPSDWRAFFNTHSPNSGGFQLDSNGGNRYRFLSTEGSETFGANTIKTTWVHLAAVVNGTDTKLYYNGAYVATGNWVESDWNGIEIGRNRNADRPGNYYLDEVRVWDAALSQANIELWMHKTLSSSHPNYSDLQVYFQMNSNSISGTTLLDASNNENNATMYNSSGINTSSSYVPVVDLVSNYQNDVESIWTSSGTADSDASDGLSMNVSSTLAEANFAVFGNNNSSGTTTDNLPSGQSLQKRSSREWQLEESGTVTVNIKIDISDATGNNITPAAASNYKLLFKSCTECDFVVNATGSSSSGDIITFSNISIQDGFYSIASTDSNI